MPEMTALEKAHSRFKQLSNTLLSNLGFPKDPELDNPEQRAIRSHINGISDRLSLSHPEIAKFVQEKVGPDGRIWRRKPGKENQPGNPDTYWRTPITDKSGEYAKIQLTNDQLERHLSGESLDQLVEPTPTPTPSDKVRTNVMVPDPPVIQSIIDELEKAGYEEADNSERGSIVLESDDGTTIAIIRQDEQNWKVFFVSKTFSNRKILPESELKDIPRWVIEQELGKPQIGHDKGDPWSDKSVGVNHHITSDRLREETTTAWNRMHGTNLMVAVQYRGSDKQFEYRNTRDQETGEIKKAYEKINYDDALSIVVWDIRGSRGNQILNDGVIILQVPEPPQPDPRSSSRDRTERLWAHVFTIKDQQTLVTLIDRKDGEKDKFRLPISGLPSRVRGEAMNLPRKMYQGQEVKQGDIKMTVEEYNYVMAQRRRHNK